MKRKKQKNKRNKSNPTKQRVEKKVVADVELPDEDTSQFLAVGIDATNEHDTKAVLKEAATEDDDALEAATEDDDTLELPILDPTIFAECDYSSSEELLNPPDDERASKWLHQMESEVERLQSVLELVDSDLTDREDKILELELEIQDRDSSAGQLLADLELARLEKQNLTDELKDTDGRNAELSEEKLEMADNLFALAEELSGQDATVKASEERNAELQAQLDRSAENSESLSALIDQGRNESEKLRARANDLSATNDSLRGEIQDLELYINGRKDSWSELNSKIADYKKSAADMKKTISGSDAELIRIENEKNTLSVRVQSLEQECAELSGCRQEQDVAYTELQARFNEQADAVEALTEDLAVSSDETDRALEKAEQKGLEQEKLLTSLKRDVAYRDEATAKLEASLEEQRASNVELSTDKGKLEGRVVELERNLEDRGEAFEGLRVELKEEKQQTTDFKAEIVEKNAKFAELAEILAEHYDTVDKLHTENDALTRERDQLHENLAAAEQSIGQLNSKLDVTETEAGSLHDEIAAQQELVAKLETDRHLHQKILGQLAQSEQRLSDLSNSLSKLERRSMLPSTHAADDQSANGGAIKEHLDPSLPHDSINNGSGNQKETNRSSSRLRSGLQMTLVSLDDETEYRLSKHDMTIGRSPESDIRIRSSFVSRNHARLRSDGSKAIIEDAGSKNGLLVNSQPVTRKLLHCGDIVSLSSTLHLKYVEVDGAGTN